MVATEKARIYLTIPDVCENHDCTLEVDNYADWEVEVKRDVLEATQKTTTFPFSFTGEAKNYIDREYSRYFQNGEGVVRVVSYGVTPAYNISYELDFGTYSSDDYRTEISCRDRDLRTLIKQNGNTEYDLPVSSVVLEVSVNHKRVTLRNELSMRRVGMDDVYNNWGESWARPAITTFLPPLTYNDADAPIKDVITYKNSQDTDDSGVKGDWFIKKEDGGVQSKQIKSFKVSYVAESENAFMSYLSGEEGKTNFYNFFGVPKSQLFFKIKFIEGVSSSGGVLAATSIPITQSNYDYTAPQKQSTTPAQYVTWGHAFESIETGEELLTYENTTGYVPSYVTMVMTLGDDTRDLPPRTVPSGFMTFAGAGDVIVSYDAKYTNSKVFACSDFEHLIRACLLNMGASDDVEVVCADDFASHVKFVCSDTLQGRTDQQFTVSFNSLANLLKMMGCSYRIEDNKLTIIPLVGTNGVFLEPTANGFTSFDVDYTEEEVADLKEDAYTELTYSEVSFSLDSNSIEGVNADLEFNRTTTFSANINSTNKLELSSKIRTDSVGFELAIPQKEGDSNKRKKDLWAIYCNEVDGFYEPETTSLNGGTTDRFNARLNPMYLMYNRWRKLLCSVTDVYKLASTDVSGSITYINVDGVLYFLHENFDAKAASDLVNNRFSVILPSTLEVSTSDRKSYITKNTLNGVARIQYNNKDYLGYLLEVTENPLLPIETTLKLLRANTSSQWFRYSFITDGYKKEIPGYAQSVAVHVSFFGMSVVPYGITAYASDSSVSVGIMNIIRSKVTLKIDFPKNTGSNPRTVTIIITDGHDNYNVAVITQKAISSNMSIDQKPAPLLLVRNTALSEAAFTLNSDYYKLSIPSDIDYHGSWVRVPNVNGSESDQYPCVPSTFFSMSYEASTNTLLVHAYGIGRPLELYTQRIPMEHDIVGGDVTTGWAKTTEIDFRK